MRNTGSFPVTFRCEFMCSSNFLFFAFCLLLLSDICLFPSSWVQMRKIGSTSREHDCERCLATKVSLSLPCKEEFRYLIFHLQCQNLNIMPSYSLSHSLSFKPHINKTKCFFPKKPWSILAGLHRGWFLHMQQKYHSNQSTKGEKLNIPPATQLLKDSSSFWI